MKKRILMAGVLMAAVTLVATSGTLADSVYYVGTNNGENHSFGTVDSLGNTTVLGTSLSFGGAGAERLMFAPNGTLYGFDVDRAGEWCMGDRQSGQRCVHPNR